MSWPRGRWPHWRRLRLPAAALLVALTAGGCLPQAATSQGREIGSLYTFFLVLAAVPLALVWGLSTWAILRYRRRRGTDELPVQHHGSTLLEVIWTGIPILTVLVLFGFTVQAIDRVDAQAPDPAVQLKVTGFRWGWQFDFPATGARVTGSLAPGPVIELPVGQTVRISVTSADVIHSFYVPAFLFKRDAIPGQVTSFDLDIQQPGTYAGQCAEFCGVYHSQMLFTVVAVEPAAFQTWLAAQPKASP